MDLQAEPVAGAVEEALHAAVLHARSVAARVEEGLDLAVDGLPVGAVVHAPVAEAHALVHERVDLLQPVRGAAAHDGAREVAEVAGLLGAREDVHHDRRVRADRPVALLVRVHGLVARARRSCATGTQPSAMMRVFTAARRSSAVKRRPSRRSQPSRPMRQARSASSPPRAPPPRRAARP